MEESPGRGKEKRGGFARSRGNGRGVEESDKNPEKRQVVKTVQMLPFPGQPGQERVMELPRGARVTRLLAGSAQASRIHTASPRTVVMFAIAIVFDIDEPPCPRRFVIVQEDQVLPDNAKHLDTTFLRAGPQGLLSFHLFEIPPKLEFPAEESGHASAQR